MIQLPPRLSYLNFREKLETHAGRVLHLQEKGFSYPSHMTLGLVTYCDQFCKGCYAGGYRFNPKIVFTAGLETLKNILRQAADAGQEYEAEGHPHYSRATLGLKAVTLVGSGEPLLYPHLGELLRFMKHDLDLDIGIYTNGNNLHDEVVRDGDIGPQAIASWVLDTCRFVRVSLDAASPETHARERGVEGQFDRILKNVGDLVERREKAGRNAPNIGLQFTIDDENVHEILRAAHMARDLGVDYLAYKPKYVPWHMRRERWTNLRLDDIRAQLDEAQTLATETFQVHGKFNQFASAWGEELKNGGQHYQSCTSIWLSSYMDVDVQSADRHAADMRFFVCVNKSKDEKNERGEPLWSAGPLTAATVFRSAWREGIGAISERIDLNQCIAGCRNDPYNRLLADMLSRPVAELIANRRDPQQFPPDGHVNHI